MSKKSSIEYDNELSQLQDRVMTIVDHTGIGFYLTGGTALSRFYLEHRYSGDLDFVLHKDPRFDEQVKRITGELANRDFGVQAGSISSTFATFHLTDLKSQQKLNLKVDFIDEKNTLHFGGFNAFEPFSKVDNIRNILSNKIGVISRREPKDIVDIWFICRNLRFRWDAVIEEAGHKGLVEEIFVVECLRNFQPQQLPAIRWVKPVNIKDFARDREIIIENIITKGENRLFSLYAAS
jgi:hypothetical protein